MEKLQGRATLTVAVIALAVAGASLLEKAPGAGAAPPKQGQPLSGDHILRVVGTSDLLVTPNEAYVQLGVIGQNKGARTAILQAKSRSDAALTAIKSLGVAADDIHMADAGLIFNHDSNAYQAGTLFTIELQDAAVSKAGPIVDAAVKAGATKCASVFLSLSDDAPANKEVLHTALANARARADSIAATTGVKITGVDSIDHASFVNGYGGPPPYKYGPQPYGGPVPQPLNCGSPTPGPPAILNIPQIAVTATVTVVYTIE